jgi:hypothetical protein
MGFILDKVGRIFRQESYSFCKRDIIVALHRKRINTWKVKFTWGKLNLLNNKMGYKGRNDREILNVCFSVQGITYPVPFGYEHSILGLFFKPVQACAKPR